MFKFGLSARGVRKLIQSFCLQTLYLPEERTYLNKHVIVRATEHDAGRYLCVAANTRGYRLRGAYLSVLPGTEIPSVTRCIPFL